LVRGYGLNIRAADAKEVGVGNPAEETCCYPNDNNVTFRQRFVNKLTLTPLTLRYCCLAGIFILALRGNFFQLTELMVGLESINLFRSLNHGVLPPALIFFKKTRPVPVDIL
jgi:hypothetical protein